MKKTILAGLAALLLLAACNSGEKKKDTAAPAETKQADTSMPPPTVNPEPEILYACPMHPEVRGKKDEKCPKCGMKLTEPVTKEGTKTN